jgi:anti-sigma factor RsiW
MQDRYFTDEELVAFLDNEPDFAPVDDIRRALRSDQALQRRLEALTLDPAAIAEDFADDVPRHSLLPLTPRKGRRGIVSALSAVAAAVLLAAGFMAGSLSTKPLNGWTEYVAAYQALYSSSTLAHVAATPAEQQTELDRVGASIGKAIPLSKLSVFPDVSYARAQVLSFEGRALIQLAFLTSTGEPVALCIIRSANVPDSQPSQTTMEGMSAASWTHGGYEYILIGGTDAAMVRRMSTSFAGMEI